MGEEIRRKACDYTFGGGCILQSPRKYRSFEKLSCKFLHKSHTNCICIPATYCGLLFFLLLGVEGLVIAC